MENRVKKGINLLDEFIPRSLEFTKSMKQAEIMLKNNWVEPKQISYYQSKLKYHNKDFAGFYCNQDTNNRRIIFNTFNIFCEKGNMPEDQIEKFHLRIEFQQGKKDKWDYEPFEALFIHYFCLLAYNKNPISFFETALNSIELVNLFKKSKLENFGRYDVWAKFWLYLSKNGYHAEKSLIAEFLFSYN